MTRRPGSKPWNAAAGVYAHVDQSTAAQYPLTCNVTQSTRADLFIVGSVLLEHWTTFAGQLVAAKATVLELVDVVDLRIEKPQAATDVLLELAHTYGVASAAARGVAASALSCARPAPGPPHVLAGAAE